MKKIFFIDDDPDDREFFRDALKELTIEIDYHEAQDGQTALDLISDVSFIPPDLIFVDLNMPGVNGLEFVIRMKQLARYQNVPVYIYTTSASARERVNCITAGAEGYIIKHIKCIDLSRELERIIAGTSLKAG